MKLLQEKQEEDRKRLEELRSENQAITGQSQTQKDTITSMTEAMEKQKGEMSALQKEITALKKPSAGGGCVIL